MMHLKGYKSKWLWYYISVTHFNIIQPLMPKPLKIFSPSGFSTQILSEFLVASVRVTSLAYSTRLFCHHNYAFLRVFEVCVFLLRSFQLSITSSIAGLNKRCVFSIRTSVETIIVVFGVFRLQRLLSGRLNIGKEYIVEKLNVLLRCSRIKPLFTNLTFSGV
jgi:hypothetical protein